MSIGRIECSSVVWFLDHYRLCCQLLIMIMRMMVDVQRRVDEDFYLWWLWLISSLIKIYNVGVLIADMMQIVESSYPHSDNEIFLLMECSHNAYEAVWCYGKFCDFVIELILIFVWKIDIDVFECWMSNTLMMILVTSVWRLQKPGRTSIVEWRKFFHSEA